MQRRRTDVVPGCQGNHMIACGRSDDLNHSIATRRSIDQWATGILVQATSRQWTKVDHSVTEGLFNVTKD